MKTYSEELKKKIVKLHIQDGRTIRSLSAEYGIGHASISNWIRRYREECQTNDAAKSVGAGITSKDVFEKLPLANA